MYMRNVIMKCAKNVGNMKSMIFVITPFWKNKFYAILTKTDDVCPPPGLEPLTGDFQQQRFTEVDQINGIKRRDREIRVHCLDVPS